MEFRQRSVPYTWRSRIVVGVILTLFVSGCDTPSLKNESATGKTNSPQEKKTSGNSPEDLSKEVVSGNSPVAASEASAATSAASSAAARVILDECIQRYKKLKSYSDRAMLKLRYRTDKSKLEKSEALQVAYESPNRLALNVLGLKATCTDSNFEAIFQDEIGSQFRNQRLVRARPEKFDLLWLIRDNLSDLLDHRVFGPPIQLHFLLDENPLTLLKESDLAISLLSPESFDGVVCDRVQIYSNKAKCVLWIDQKEKLLRKYEMPVELIQRMIAPNEKLDLQQSELSVEIYGATGDSSLVWSNWDLPRKESELLLSRFVDSPPWNTPPQLGKTAIPFDLRDVDGKIILDSAQRNKPLTVLCFVENNELGSDFVKYGMQVHSELETQKITAYAEMIFVSPSSATEMREAFKNWKCNLPLAIDLEKIADKVFGLSRMPSVVVLDKTAIIQHVDEVGFLEQLPDLLRRLYAGENRAARILQENVDNQARFISRLHRATLEKIQADRLPAIEPFPMVNHVVQPTWKVDFDTKIVAAGGEHFLPAPRANVSPEEVFSSKAMSLRVMTVLDEGGKIFAVDHVGNKKHVADIPIEKADKAKRIHIANDPWTHQWIAIIPEGLPRYWLLEMPMDMNLVGKDYPKEPTEYTLDESDSATVFAWTNQGLKSSLTIAMSSGKIHVLDPIRGKAFKAQLPGIAAIVPTLNEQGVSLAWNAVDFKGALFPIDNLPSDSSADVPTTPNMENVHLPFVPEQGNWTWGRNFNESVIVGPARFATGETGAVLYNQKYDPLLTHPLCVRSEQARLIASTTLSNGAFYWLATAPRRVLHLQTKNGYLPDQMSLGTSVIGAAMHPDDVHLRMTLAIDHEVSCWRVYIPQPPPTENVTPSPADKSKAGNSGSDKNAT